MCSFNLSLVIMSTLPSLSTLKYVLIFHKLCERCSPEMGSCNELEVGDIVIDNRLVILV